VATAASLYPRRRVAFLLGGCAGFLDAVGYLTVGIFIANMTGNTVLLGIFAGHAQWGLAGRASLVLAAFFAGAMVATAVLRRWRRLAGVMAAEAVLLLLAVAAWGVVRARPPHTLPESGAFLVIALLGGAMGMQSAAVRRVGEQPLATTFITGNMTSLAVHVTGLLTAGAGGGSGHASTPPQGMSVLAAVWGSYLAGAIAGGAGDASWGFWCVVAPAAVLVVLAAWDLSQGPTILPSAAATPPGATP